MTIIEALHLAGDFAGSARASRAKIREIKAWWPRPRFPSPAQKAEIAPLERSAARARARAEALLKAVDQALIDNPRAPTGEASAATKTDPSRPVIAFRGYSLEIVAYRRQHLKVRGPGGVEVNISRSTGRALTSSYLRSRGRAGTLARSHRHFFGAGGEGRLVIHAETLTRLVENINRIEINTPKETR